MRLRSLALSLGFAVALLAGSLPASAEVTADEALTRALVHVRANSSTLGVTANDVADLFVTSNFSSAHNGVTHVNLNQRYEGLEVFGGHASVAMKADGSILHAAGSLVRGLAIGASGSPAIGALGAVEAAAGALGLAPPTGLQVLSAEGGPARKTTCSSAGVSREPIPARLGWQPTAAGLRKAWQLVIDDSSGPHLWNATVDAETGGLLDVQDWTAHDPMADLEATLGQALLSPTVPVGPPNPVIDGSSYRVLAVPTESPNDRDRQLIDNPADGSASPFGWHDDNGVAGPEFTITRGNNAHAYLEQDANNQPDFGQDVEGGAGLDFDFPADLTQHSQAYREAVTTNLFYGCNVIHDITWRYGFDEASGNFQANNYGRGGTGGDAVRCEAADGSGTNNANFSTPAADGSAPRMQMFLWPGNQFGPQNEVVVDGVGSFGSSWARFSPPPTNAGTAGRIINAGNGCIAADYAGNPGGDWMAVVTGGNTGCQNITKARTADAAGANALIVAHTNATQPAPILTGSLTTAAPTIPVASITLADGDAIRAAIAGGPVTGTVRKHPSHPGIRDGDFENGIIFHEYGHGISNRLTGGLNVNCLSGNEQAGEGWSDYYAITLLLDPNLDDPQGPRGMGPYALFQPNRQGNGIRPRPYSRDMTIQPFTYDSIKTNAWLNGTSLSLPHGLGHGWASVLWDLNWDLIDKHAFNPDVYGDWSTGGNNRALQYVTDGLKLQGCFPGLVASRNGILAGAAALDGGADVCTVWAAFARRGLGFSAVQGTTNRNDNTEAFDTHSDCRKGFKSPVHPTYGTLTSRTAGSTVPLKFTVTGLSGPDILAPSNSPFSRRVDCTTLRVPSSGEFITPRELPIDTVSPGNSGLSSNGNGTYHYNWKTLAEWAGTCREVVVTRKDGVQHRAFFRFEAGT